MLDPMRAPNAPVDQSSPDQSSPDQPAPDQAAPDQPALDRGTRDRVSREILERGPIAASELAVTLGLTPAAVRRHLDGLTAQGLVTTWAGAEGATPRRRGRPARRFVLTDAGHAAISNAHDDLANQLLEFLSATAGAEAVR